MLPGIPAASAATTPTAVSLTFDNGAISQYTLGYQQALQPHGVNATFYVSSGSVGNASKMSWPQLSALAAAGSEIGGKTVDGTSLTSLSTAQQVSEICNDRQAILQHGLKPFSFAYPGTAPTVSVSSPSSGSSFTQKTKVTISASATDLGTGSGAPSGIASVTFYLDGTTKLGTDTSSPYSLNWNTSKVAKGTHTLTAVATDAAGNSATSAAVTVTIK